MTQSCTICLAVRGAAPVGNRPKAAVNWRVKLAKAWLDAKLADRKGSVVFDVSGWGDASGHFTLWNGTTKTLAYAEPHDNPENNMYYFWLTSLEVLDDGTKFLVQVVSVKFWELK